MHTESRILLSILSVFFFTHTAPTEIYTLSLHDALPISGRRPPLRRAGADRGRDLRLPRLRVVPVRPVRAGGTLRDRKSTRLNSSHANISYAVFCLKKKKKEKNTK